MTDRNVAVFAIALCALALRLRGIGFGLPELHHPDEPLVVYRSLLSVAHGCTPEQPEEGAASFLIGCVATLLYAIERCAGRVTGVQDFLTTLYRDPTALYTLIRGLFCLTDAITALLVYRLARRITHSRVTASLAGLLYATALGPVAESHFAKGHSLSACFVVLSLLALVSSVQGHGERDLQRASLAAGAAIACKAYCLALLPCIALAAMFRFQAEVGSTRVWRMARRIALCALGILVGFVLLFPGALLYPGQFAAGVWSYLFRVTGPGLDDLGIPGYWYFVREVLPASTSWPTVLLAGCGLLTLLIRDDRSGAVVFAFVATTLIGLGRGPLFARYALGLVAVGCVLAAHAYETLPRSGALRLGVHAAWLLDLVIGGMLIGLHLDRSMRFVNLLAAPDTRTQCVRWFEEHVPASTPVVVGGMWGPHQRSLLGPPLVPCPEQLASQLVSARAEGNGGRLLMAIISATRGRTCYPIRYGTRIDEITLVPVDAASDPRPPWATPAQLRAMGYMWLVDTNWVPRYYLGERWHSQGFWNGLAQNYTVEKRFVPRPSFRWDPLAWRWDLDALSRVPLWGGDVVRGPQILVFKASNSQAAPGTDPDGAPQARGRQ